MTLNYTYNTKTEPMPEPIKIEESKHEGKHCIKKYYKSLEDCKNSIPNCMYFHTQLENSSIKVITGRNYCGGVEGVIIDSITEHYTIMFDKE